MTSHLWYKAMLKVWRKWIAVQLHLMWPYICATLKFEHPPMIIFIPFSWFFLSMQKRKNSCSIALVVTLNLCHPQVWASWRFHQWSNRFDLVIPPWPLPPQVHWFTLSYIQCICKSKKTRKNSRSMYLWHLLKWSRKYIYEIPYAEAIFF